MQWLAPWSDLSEGSTNLAAAYERELQAELDEGHPLFGVRVSAIGKHDGTDDVLFQLLDGTGRVAVVHLTWARHPEAPPWPATELFADFTAFEEQQMKPSASEPQTK